MMLVVGMCMFFMLIMVWVWFDCSIVGISVFVSFVDDMMIV